MKDKNNLDDYCALAIAGGDGSIHESINGMLYRKDKKKLPIALLPNGSGNDFAYGFCLDNYKQGLDYIRVGHVIKVDVLKIVLDYENEE